MPRRQRQHLPDKSDHGGEARPPPAYFSPLTPGPSAFTATGPDVERLLPVAHHPPFDPPPAPPAPPDLHPQPPPAFSYLNSSTSNATGRDSDRAKLFCHTNPLWQACVPHEHIYARVQAGDVSLVAPPPGEGEGLFRGKLSPESSTSKSAPAAAGRRECRTDPQKNGDCLLRTQLPLYFAARDDPFILQQQQLNNAYAFTNQSGDKHAHHATKTIYFEVTYQEDAAADGDDHDDGNAVFSSKLARRLLHRRRRRHCRSTSHPGGISIGFIAMPYPSWRSPGWERGGLGVFSDDGRKYTNNSLGGKEFTVPFREHERVGIGMQLSAPWASPSFKAVHVFFTRNGALSGSWDLFEPVDQTEGGVEGLEGDHDIYGAIGLWGGSNIKAYFNSRDWLFDPLQFGQECSF